jgi:rare lipoprotein A (peptidoglycan hydrolase)
MGSPGKALIALVLMGCSPAPTPAPTPPPVLAQPSASTHQDVADVIYEPVAPSTHLQDLPRRAIQAPVRIQTNPPVRPPRSSKGSSISGQASWYCRAGISICHHSYPPGSMVAAAGPGLRIGKWRGRTVTVTSGGRSIRVKLVDWCQCGNGVHLIDLYSAAFQKLAPLSSGVVRVTVSW